MPDPMPHSTQDSPERAASAADADTPKLLDTARLEAVLHDFADARDWHRFHTPKNLAMALSVEVAELVEIFQWQTEAESAAVMKSSEARHVEQELADIALYLIRLSAVLGVDLDRAIADKLVLNARKYPAPERTGPTTSGSTDERPADDLR